MLSALRSGGRPARQSSGTDFMARFVITVEFQLLPGALDPFLALIKDNARRSLADEPDCHRFDVLVRKGEPDHILLYEIYADRAAFDFHLKTRHFAEFSRASAPYVREKRVIEFEYVNDGKEQG
jgi:quinol monooxygenase YgiN